MMKLYGGVIFLCCTALTAYAAVTFVDFEEYLAQMDDHDDKSSEEEEAPDVPEGSAADWMTTTPAPVYRPRSTCCDLGRIAGVEGFHCNPDYYKPQIYIRNRNRSHNAKIHFDEGEERQIGFKQSTRQFRKCVSGFSQRLQNEFHKCCKIAYLENEKAKIYERRLKAASRDKHRDMTAHSDRHMEEELFLIH